MLRARSGSVLRDIDLAVKARSPTNIVHPSLDLKSWMRRTPSCDEARPAKCPCCQAPSRPLGKALGLWGHGLRYRQQRGPMQPGAVPQILTVPLRRYWCRHCHAVLQVVPRGVLPHKHFAAAALVLALFLFGLQGLPAAQVRQQISPWTQLGLSAQGGWHTIKRWLLAQRQGRLFPQVRAVPKDFTLRQVAQRVATTALSFAPPGTWGLSPPERAFYGGAQMA